MNIKKVLIIAIIATAPLHGMPDNSQQACGPLPQKMPLNPTQKTNPLAQAYRQQREASDYIDACSECIKCSTKNCSTCSSACIKCSAENCSEHIYEFQKNRQKKGFALASTRTFLKQCPLCHICACACFICFIICEKSCCQNEKTSQEPQNAN